VPKGWNVVAAMVVATGAAAATPAAAAPGPITEYRIPSGSAPIAVTSGADGALWFSAQNQRTYWCPDGSGYNVTTARIGRVATDGTFREFELPDGSGCGGDDPAPHFRHVDGITAGPDGALWFVDWYGIGRMTTDGALTAYPGMGSQIAAGPDGALWFTTRTPEEMGSMTRDAIGRITTGGEETLYPLPPLCSDCPRYDLNANGITDGPDGALWFTDRQSIGRITTTGAVTRYDVPGTWFIWGIASGPDGNLWFCDSQGHIGRITTAGVSTVVASLGEHANLRDITAGPDGNLWFVGANPYSDSWVGRITPGGEVTTFQTPTEDSGPTEVAAGEDGRLWFGEGSAGQIGASPTEPTNGVPAQTLPIVPLTGSLASAGIAGATLAVVQARSRRRRGAQLPA
jgi:virginiamycin B lyase